MSENIYKLLRRASRLTGRSYRSLKKSWHTLRPDEKKEYKQRLTETLNNIENDNSGYNPKKKRS